MTEQVKELKKLTDASDNIVFFGGAGVSTESGIPDFRSEDGLYHQQYDYPPEQILSHSFFMANPKEFYRFYHAKMICPEARPNAAHRKLAEWEKEGRLRAVITQNIDNLHQMAGSKNVLELHGSTHRNYCMSCGETYTWQYVAHSEGVPRCEHCGGLVRPDVVLYEEALDMDVMERAVDYISKADILIVGGTSLAVYPAAGLIRYYRGDKLVLINKSTTSYDRQARLCIAEPIGEVLGQL